MQCSSLLQYSNLYFKSTGEKLIPLKMEAAQNTKILLILTNHSKRAEKQQKAFNEEVLGQYFREHDVIWLEKSCNEEKFDDFPKLEAQCEGWDDPGACLGAKQLKSKLNAVLKAINTLSHPLIDDSTENEEAHAILASFIKTEPQQGEMSDLPPLEPLQKILSNGGLCKIQGEQYRLEVFKEANFYAHKTFEQRQNGLIEKIQKYLDGSAQTSTLSNFPKLFIFVGRQHLKGKEASLKPQRKNLRQTLANTDHIIFDPNIGATLEKGITFSADRKKMGEERALNSKKTEMSFFNSTPNNSNMPSNLDIFCQGCQSVANRIESFFLSFTT